VTDERQSVSKATTPLIEWLGAIPHHWTSKKFSRAVFIAEGQVDPTAAPFAAMTLVAPNHVESGTGRLVGRETAQEQAAESGKYLCQRGDVIYSKIRPGLRKVAVARERCLCSADMYPLRSRGQLDARFLLYLLLSDAFTAWAVQESGRVAMPKINREALSDLRLPIPPPKEQRSIADRLDRETARIDALIAAKERLLGLLAEKRRALITRAVTRGLDPDIPLRDSGIPWLREIPAHWETQRIAWLYKERDERGEPELPLLEVSINAGVVLREFSGERIESTAADFNTYKVARAGDVVFNKMRMWQGAVGVAPEDGLVSPDYVVAEPVGALTSAYARLLFRTGAFSAECARHSHGIVWDRLRLYWEGFREIEVPLPGPGEQARVVADVEDATGKLGVLSDVAERTISLLKERRSSLIAAAVTGQIDVEAVA
jgi:type I restriction enzyme S subunit